MFPEGVVLVAGDPQTERPCLIHRDTPPEKRWDAVTRNGQHPHLAMASQWYSVIGDTYSHKPLYFRGEDTDGRTAVLPAFFISHWLLGRTVTSMPFLDAGGPFGGGDRLTYALVKHLLTEADKLGAHRVEFRCTSEICLHIRPYLEKVTLTLPLPADPDRLWRDLDAKVRNQVRKAERAGVSVEIGGAQYLDEFYDVFAINMRDLGSPVHAKVFFQAILESFGQSARIALARRGTSPLGALISITFNDTVYVPWASSLREYAALCPNMLLYWETLRASCRAGVTRFDFGRSTRGSGTYRFKRQWGAQEAQLYWYSVPLREGSVTRLSANDRSGARMSRLWSKLPVRITRVLGPLIRGYLPQ